MIQRNFKKIIYISIIPVSEHILNKWFIDEFINNNVLVEIWNVGKIVKYEGLKDASVYPMESKFLSKKSFIKALNALNNNQVVVSLMIPLESKTIWIYTLLKDKNFFVMCMHRGLIPDKSFNENLRMKTFRRVFSLLFGNMSLSYILSRFVFLLRIKYTGLDKFNFDVIFVSGGELHKRYSCKTSMLVNVNSQDYDNYRKIKNEKEVYYKEGYIVFLDENVADHPDTKYFNQQRPDPGNYYQGLTDYFDKIEEKFGMPVIIAMHPTSNQGSLNYNNRKEVFGSTGKLIKDSNFVITHSSTATGYAVLFKKPIMFIYNNEIKSLGDKANYPMILSFYNNLGGCLYNTDSVLDYKTINYPLKSLRKFNLYKYNFLTSKSSEKEKTSTIVFNELIRLFSSNS
jgi:hypothetical protein